MRTSRKFTFIDLFAGAGGFSLGFARAKFKCVGVVERDPVASETYKINFSDHAEMPLCRLGSDDGDIHSLTRADFDNAFRSSDGSEVDLLLAGPPCQGFSKVGRGKLNDLANRKQAFKTDPRNGLYLKFLDVLRWIKPRAFLFENVPGILHLSGSNVAEDICENGRKAGYSVLCTILNSAWYGVPQIRERVFILGIRSDLAIRPSFPKPIYRAQLTKGHLTALELSEDTFANPLFFRKVENPSKGPRAVSVLEALGDLPPFLKHLTDSEYFPIREEIHPSPYRRGRPSPYAALMRRWDRQQTSMEVLDHFCRATRRDFETFDLMKPGDMYPRAVEIAEQRYQQARNQYQKGLRDTFPRRKHFVPPYNTENFEEKWWKMVPSKPSRTITAHLARDCYSHIHYDSQKRAITVREAARLQSFPDTFKFSGNMGDCFRQIGNAVPPLLAYSLARHLSQLLARADANGCNKNRHNLKSIQRA